MANSELVIGVDGGGTKTVAAIAPAQPGASEVILGRGRAGPGNPRAVGFEAAQANIEAAIEAAFAEAGIQRAPAAAACFGLAGAGRVVEQEQIAAWAKGRNIARHVRVTHDAEPVLTAAAPENVGIALLCGTGSLAWGQNREGATARVGGWGYLLGDEGSAYAIARSALQAAMRAADGRGAATQLLDSFQHELDAANPEQLVERIYAAEMSRERMAGLANIVFAAAASDPVAQDLIDTAAEELALLVTTLSRTLALESGMFPLALSGSVIVQQKLFRDSLQDCLVRAGIAPGETILVLEPVRGAVATAQALVGAR